jgi:hypothetical protein
MIDLCAASLPAWLGLPSPSAQSDPLADKPAQRPFGACQWAGATNATAHQKEKCMSAAPVHDPNQDAPELIADDPGDAMKDQLRRDVASWRDGRSDASSRQATELSVAVARSIVPPRTAKMQRTKRVVVETKAASSEKKPFGMSYDGTSRADYIKLMISRGAR